jgi:hypothetical protein
MLGLIAIAVVMVAGLVGTALFVYAVTRPDPTITLTSSYHALGLPAGANTTTISVHGQHFSRNEAIIFFLDGGQLTDLPPVGSDGNGSFTTTLPVGKAWSTGKHILTARDSDHYLTQQGATLVIVAAGQANTPGPDGAPSDSASFTISATFTGTILETGGLDISSETIAVTGHPDPTGGKVCGEHENGKPFVTQSTFLSTGTPYTVTQRETCAGTYQEGKLEEDITVIAQSLTYTLDGADVVCSAPTPYILEHIQGTFSSATTISGTFTMAGITYTCSSSDTITQEAETGSWTGRVSG